MKRLGHARDANRYAARVARRQTRRFTKIEPPVHMTDPDGVLAALRSATPVGHVIDFEGTGERIVEHGVTKSVYGGGKYGFVTKYRYVER